MEIRQSEKTTIDAMINAAQDAGRLLRERAFDYGALEWKKKDDPVTELDRLAEERIKDVLRKAAPGNFLGEEGGYEGHALPRAYLGHDLPRTYFIDPIDGTKSFILRDFVSSISIGLKEDDELTGGVVYDFMRDIMYVGFHGDRYLLHDGKRHEFRDRHPLDKVRISVDGNPKAKMMLKRHGYSVTEKCGSIALAMAELAAGNLDGMVCASMGKGNIWDVAAGYYLLKTGGFHMTEYAMHCIAYYEDSARFRNPFDYRDGAKGLIAIREGLEAKVLEDAGLNDVRGTGWELRKYD